MAAEASPGADEATGRLGQLFVERTPASSGAPAATVVCVHGSMDRHASFARLRARLTDDFDVVVYDRRGYAASRGASPAATMSEHVDDLVAVLDGEPALLVGHSFGGDVALACCERRPDLVQAALVFEPPLPWLAAWRSTGESGGWAPGSGPGAGGATAPGSDGPPPGPPWAAPTPELAAERFLRRMLGDQRYERVPRSTRDELAKDGPALVAEMTSIRSGPPPFRPADISTRVVVAYGTASADRQRRATTWLADELEHGELRAVEGAGHGAHRSHARELAALVYELSAGA